METIEMIPCEFRNAGLTLRLVKREKDIALYEIFNAAGLPMSWEVHQIRLQKGRQGTIGGKSITFKTKERLASDEDFGTWALSLSTLERAEQVYQSWISKSSWLGWSTDALKTA